MAIEIDYSLYLVTDRSFLDNMSLAKAVEAAIKGGVTAIQIREKDISTRAFYDIALSIKKVANYYKIPLFINDRIDIAMAVDAEGVHLGQSDMKLEIARKILGNKKIIGISAQNISEAIDAEKHGADYIGVGAVFYTNTKNDINKPIELKGLRSICNQVKIPAVAIGGINSSNIKDVISAGANGAAVISAILGEKDIEAAAAGLLKLVKK
jgi:thiamine-phosphate pyrophosphorylase